MFENILYQKASSLIQKDILSSSLPPSLLFYGDTSSGKLSCALEVARVLSCSSEQKGIWQCTCNSCLRHKSLISQNVIVAGPRDCALEIAASLDTFENAYKTHASYENATRYLFLRSVRKLTLRFSQVLWQDDDKLSKIASIIPSLDEYIELIDFPHELPDFDSLHKICLEIQKLCQKLESTFLSDSIPIKQIRNISAWAHIKSPDQKKTVILENAERMNESARNALLKILEEPPEDTVFILTTNSKNAIMPTILSRVRPYQFIARNEEEQQEVIKRVFHNENFSSSLNDFFETYLPISPSVLKGAANEFFQNISNNKIPDIAKIIKDCSSFEVRIMFRIFLDALAKEQKPFINSAASSECSALFMVAIRQCWSDVTIYNQSIIAALENLTRTFFKINKLSENIFKVSYE